LKLIIIGDGEIKKKSLENEKMEVSSDPRVVKELTDMGFSVEQVEEAL
jgi:hypothetical protein